jgi:hypothetical protein
MERSRCFLRYRIDLFLRLIELISRLAQFFILYITYDLTSVFRIDYASLLHISIIYFLPFSATRGGNLSLREVFVRLRCLIRLNNTGGGAPPQKGLP